MIGECWLVVTKLDLGRSLGWVVTPKADRCVPRCPMELVGIWCGCALGSVRGFVTRSLHKEMQVFQLSVFRQFRHADDSLSGASLVGVRGDVTMLAAALESLRLVNRIACAASERCFEGAAAIAPTAWAIG